MGLSLSKKPYSLDIKTKEVILTFVVYSGCLVFSRGVYMRACVRACVCVWISFCLVNGFQWSFRRLYKESSKLYFGMKCNKCWYEKYAMKNDPTWGLTMILIVVFIWIERQVGSYELIWNITMSYYESRKRYKSEFSIDRHIIWVPGKISPSAQFTIIKLEKDI